MEKKVRGGGRHSTQVLRGIVGEEGGVVGFDLGQRWVFIKSGGGLLSGGLRGGYWIRPGLDLVVVLGLNN